MPGLDWVPLRGAIRSLLCRLPSALCPNPWAKRGRSLARNAPFPFRRGGGRRRLSGAGGRGVLLQAEGCREAAVGGIGCPWGIAYRAGVACGLVGGPGGYRARLVPLGVTVAEDIVRAALMTSVLGAEVARARG